jgi:hypothetical protein
MVSFLAEWLPYAQESGIIEYNDCLLYDSTRCLWRFRASLRGACPKFEYDGLKHSVPDLARGAKPSVCNCYDTSPP